MAARGAEDSEDPISLSTASSEDLLPCDESEDVTGRQLQRSRSANLSTTHSVRQSTAGVSAAAAASQQQADEEENLDDLLQLLQDSDDDEPSAAAQQHIAPPPKRARRLPGWMATAARPPPKAARPATADAHSTRTASNALSGPSSSVASRQMERAFEQDQAQKRRKLEDAKASSSTSSSSGDAATPRLLGALVDPAGTLARAAGRPELTLLTRALFPRRVVVFDVETTGFAQDDVIVEIGGVELIDGVRTVWSLPPSPPTHYPSTTIAATWQAEMLRALF
jgi:hypothetical protein|eukprot:COSAG02_NODE_4100_length_5776_cov_2.594504_3_plen_281_part_00